MVSVVRGAMLMVTLICWIMSIYKLRDLVRAEQAARRSGAGMPNRSLRSLCIALVAITFSLTVQPLMPDLDRFFGVVDLARLASNSATLACGTAAQAFLLYLASTDATVRRQVHRRWIALAATVLLMVALFAITPPATDVTDPRVESGEYYGDPFSGPFLFPYLAYLAWSLVQVVILSNRYAAIAHRPLTRFGLRLIVVGSIWGLGYIAAKLTAIMVGAVRPSAALAIDAVVVACFTISILLVLIGSTIPSWGPRIGLDRFWSWLMAILDCYRLHPLWAAISAVLPHLALLSVDKGPAGALAVAKEATLRRVRMTIEILDGYATLRPWMSGQVFKQAHQAARAAGLSGDKLNAATEAAVVAVALDAHRRRLPPAKDARDTPALPLGAARNDPTASGDGHAADDVTWLAQVARLYETELISNFVAEMASPAVDNPYSSER